MRGHKTLPFKIEAVAQLFQTDEDKSPIDRAGWLFFDDWMNQMESQGHTKPSPDHQNRKTTPTREGSRLHEAAGVTLRRTRTTFPANEASQETPPK